MVLDSIEKGSESHRAFGIGSAYDAVAARAAGAIAQRRRRCRRPCWRHGEQYSRIIALAFR